jgi:hypothetical protein
MRLRLLVRRLTISAPRVAVRSAMPWPIRWIVLALVFGFCAAIALWAFEFGKDIAGLDRGVKAKLQETQADLANLREEIATLKVELDKAQTIANTADMLLTAEKAAQERLAVQNKQLESVNQSLRDDLGFFETLIPAAGSGVEIRRLQADNLNARELKWQVLVMQSSKNSPEFSGQLTLNFTGELNGKPWMGALAGGALPFKVKQYGRVEGVYEIPLQVTIKGVTAKVMDGATTRAMQTIEL